MDYEFFEQPIFSNSIFSSQLNIDNEKIYNHVKILEKENNGNVISNVGGFQSKNFRNEFDLDETFKVIKAAFSIGNKIVNDVWRYQHQLSSFYYWYNLNKPMSYNHTHIHTGCLISGCYYVKTPKNCGSIVFMRNEVERLSFKYLEEIYNLKINGDCNKHTASNWTVLPKENQLILFPSSTPHYVEQNLSDEDRISIAFNLY